MEDEKESSHSTAASEGEATAANPAVASANPEDARYGGFTRFELELEFVSLLSSPAYLSHLATTKVLQQPSFVAYLKYLLYWTQPPYLHYLSYPGPTLRALELLQQEEFRKEVMKPEIVARLAEAMLEASVRD